MGAALDVAPTLRVGARVQLTLHWPFVGAFGALDIFGSAPQPLRGTFGFQLGL